MVVGLGWTACRPRLAPRMFTIVLALLWGRPLQPCYAIGSSGFDTGETEGYVWISNPVARHVACPIEANIPTTCRLAAHEDGEHPVDFLITTLPEAGLLYETSPNFRADGSDPKHMPDVIGEHLLPYKVTDPLQRVIYVPPYNVWPPEGYWASFEYRVVFHPPRPEEWPLSRPDPDPITSEAGLVVLSNPDGAIAGSNFDLAGGDYGWSITGNLAESEWAGGLKHQANVWGGLSRYVYGVDEVLYMDFATGLDQTRWYFEASRDFHGRELAAAYGGKIKFTVRALYGNFTQLNSPLDWITIECESCNTGYGLRIVRFIDENFFWEGSEKVVEVDLKPTARWMKDPLNSAMEFAYADECLIAAVLTNVSRVAILGDFTRGGEGVALDDVQIIGAIPSMQPAHPYYCQQGCVCRHNPSVIRPMCC
mmetsp:Transcript_65449/g.182145  ORF Transcript_65449/g.182145 Transcript_65449/m.182145 type:complete len:423 (-) Transcript_65449:72-1340(-)